MLEKHVKISLLVEHVLYSKYSKRSIKENVPISTLIMMDLREKMK